MSWLWLFCCISAALQTGMELNTTLLPLPPHCSCSSGIALEHNFTTGTAALQENTAWWGDGTQGTLTSTLTKQSLIGYQKVHEYCL